MKKGFEDAFMDAQSSTISLCLELLEKYNIQVDTIYVYLFQNECQDFPNAFFKKDNKILRLNDIFDDEDIDEFFDLLIEDIENIIEICDNYESTCPNELKLIYDVNSGKFDSEYGYEDIVEDEDSGLVSRLDAWIDECDDN